LTDYDIYQKARERAFELIQKITHEPESEQLNRYMNETSYNAVIDEITHVYYVIATNEHFQQDNKEMVIRLSKLFGYEQ
jgi:hypothetical protein